MDKLVKQDRRQRFFKIDALNSINKIMVNGNVDEDINFFFGNTLYLL